MKRCKFCGAFENFKVTPGSARATRFAYYLAEFKIWLRMLPRRVWYFFFAP